PTATRTPSLHDALPIFPALRRVCLSTTSTFLTIPSFALFALMIPLFGLGIAPTILALTIYAIYPILRNAVTGLDGVAPGLIDAADRKSTRLNSSHEKIS